MGEGIFYPSEVLFLKVKVTEESLPLPPPTFGTTF